MLQCWKSFVNIQGVHFSPPSACLAPPPTPLPAVFPLSLRRSHKTILSRADAREDQSETALPATRPRKTDRVARGPGHPTTAESWIALPATLPRKDKVSRGRGHPTTQRVGLHCLRPSQERQARFQEDGGILLLQRVGLHCLWPSQERRARFQEDGGILLLQRVGLHCLRHSQERRTGFQEDGGHPTTAESWITLPATLPRKTDKVSRGWGHPTTAESWITLPATLPRKTGKVSRGWGNILLLQRVGSHCLRPSQERQGFKRTGASYYCRGLDRIACDPPKKDRQGFKRTGASYYCRGLDRIACDPPKKDGQGFKRMGASYYCRELEGFVSCRLLGALPTPSSMTTPHPAPWWPTSSSTTAQTWSTHLMS